MGLRDIYSGFRDGCTFHMDDLEFLLLGAWLINRLFSFQSSRRLTLIRSFWIHGSAGYIFIVNLVMVF